jgi:hypothetical protein
VRLDEISDEMVDMWLTSYAERGEFVSDTELDTVHTIAKKDTTVV